MQQTAPDERATRLRTYVQKAAEEFINRTRALFESKLYQCLDQHKDTEVIRIARYICHNGGHRWRPLLLLATGEIFIHDGEQTLMPAACGLELVHSASLLLDDLPSMDDARLRRGQPCPHLVFPRWAIDMAAPFLVNLAYSMLLQCHEITPQRRLQAAIDLGDTGIALCEGQVFDLQDDPAQPPLDDIIDCYRLKTGSLYGAATRIAAILCGGNQEIIAALSRCGTKLGLAVQCFDDVADVVGDVKVCGKHPGNDAAKQTIVDYLGIEGAIAAGKQFQEEALSELDPLAVDDALLRQLIKIIPRAIVPARITE